MIQPNFQGEQISKACIENPFFSSTEQSVLYLSLLDTYIYN